MAAKAVQQLGIPQLGGVQRPPEVPVAVAPWLLADLPAAAEVARRAGHSPEVIHRRYAGVIDNSEEQNNRKIEKTMGWAEEGTAMCDHLVATSAQLAVGISREPLRSI